MQLNKDEKYSYNSYLGTTNKILYLYLFFKEVVKLLVYHIVKVEV